MQIPSGKSWRLGAISALLSIAVGGESRAWVAIGDVWGVPVIEIETDLGTREDGGGAAGPLRDGSADFDVAFAQAAARWNVVLEKPRLVVTANSAMVPTDGDVRNQVFFSDSVYGVSFGDAVAVTVGFTYDPVPGGPGFLETAEKDIIFNSAFEWDSYRGELVADSTDERFLQDFRRIAIHELGHLLGLDHPNKATPVQTVAAIMNSGGSQFVEDLKADDIEGANAIYRDVVYAGPEIAETVEVPSIRLADARQSRVRTRKRAIVFRGFLTGGTKAALQNRRTGTTKFFRAAADGSWRGRMKLEPGRNKFLIVSVDEAGFAMALTKAVVVRKVRKDRRR